MLLRLIIYLIFSQLFFATVYAQKSKDRATLEREKKKNIDQINKMRKILSQTQKEKQNTLGEIKLLSQQIENQENKISLAKEDIELIKVEMAEIETAKNDLFHQLKSLQTEYAQTLYRESKNSKKLSKLGFLFSSSSINELYLRYKYLEQYSEDRKNQLNQITKIAEMLKERQRTLLAKKITQQNLINEIKTETKNLEGLKEQQSLAINELSKKETELKSELDKQRKSLSSLNSLISNVIAKEKNNRKESISRRVPASRKEKAEELAERERKILESRNKTKITDIENKKTEVEKTSTYVPKGNFAANKSKLKWPVEGFVSDKFGVKPHPVLKGLKIDNNGIDIQTSPNAPVKTVFTGIVLDISQIPGLNNVVAVQHGDYYTVYANLDNVNVKINQEVNANQVIGTAAYKDGSPEINFQIWHNFNKLNPESWLGTK